MKFCNIVRLKHSNDQGEFELDRTRSKNNITENSFALEHETRNNKIIRIIHVSVDTCIQIISNVGVAFLTHCFRRLTRILAAG